MTRRLHLCLLLLVSCSAFAQAPAGAFKPKLFPVYDRTGANSGWGYIDRNGQMIVPPTFHSAFDFSDHLAVADKFGVYSVINESGKIIRQTQGYRIGRYKDGLAPYSTGRDSGFIDINGNIVFAFNRDYSSSREFNGGLLRIERLNERSGKEHAYNTFKSCYVDKAGKVVIPCEYDKADDFSDGVAAVGIRVSSSHDLSGDRYDVGYIDKSGRRVIWIGVGAVLAPFSEGLACVKQDGRTYYINKKGEQVIQLDGDTCGVFSEGLASFHTRDGHWAFLDATGKIAILGGKGYASYYGFNEGLAAAPKGKNMGYIDHTGAFVIKPQFDRAEEFNGGLARVTLRNGKVAYIDTEGRFVWGPKPGPPCVTCN